MSSQSTLSPYHGHHSQSIATHPSVNSSASNQVYPPVPNGPSANTSSNQNAISPPKSTTPPTPPVVVPGLPEMNNGGQPMQPQNQAVLTDAVNSAFSNGHSTT